MSAARRNPKEAGFRRLNGPPMGKVPGRRTETAYKDVKGGRLCQPRRSPMLPGPTTVNAAAARKESCCSYPGRSHGRRSSRQYPKKAGTMHVHTDIPNSFVSDDGLSSNSGDCHSVQSTVYQAFPASPCPELCIKSVSSRNKI